MVTIDELMRVLLGPLLVATFLSLLGRWRKWAWIMPLAFGAAFLTGYSLIGIPKLPPRDGTDWLYWVMVPATVWGILDALLGSGKELGWFRGMSSWVVGGIVGGICIGGASVIIILPLARVGGTPNSTQCWQLGVAIGAAGAVMIWLLGWAQRRLGTLTVIAGLWITLGATAVMVMSSNLRIVGVYGLAAAAALAPLALFMGKVPAVRSVTMLALALLSAELVSGHYYADPGVTWTHALVLGLAPLGLVLATLVPGKHGWVRAIVGLLLVSVAVATVTVPAALAAKKAAEDGGDTESMYSSPAGR